MAMTTLLYIGRDLVGLETDGGDCRFIRALLK